MSCFFNHSFGKWKITERGAIQKTNLYASFFQKGSGEMGKKTVGSFFTQERTCEVCGFTEINQQKVDINDY